jgi:hypothetical protein
MSAIKDDLWTLTFARPWIDADALAAAVEQEACKLNKQKIESRLRESGGSHRAVVSLEKNASTNWYILYGESLPK